ncbi:MAG: adenylosuccinate lyase [Chloroflexota bacterium]|nr:adenylosuccinate lyase [Chloroflexota bacterium]
MTTFSHDTFVSPLTWRYGSAEMRQLWSEIHKRQLLRKVWFALAKAQHEFGLVTAEQLNDLYEHIGHVDIDRATEIEKDIKHDLMAELRTYAEQCPVGGAVLHLGATSMDVLDNADVLRIKESLEHIQYKMNKLRDSLAELIEVWAATAAIGFTHLQPAEPTTIGYRLAQFGQDLLIDYAEILRVCNGIRGKGFKGAVGTAASYVELLDGDVLAAEDLERRAMQILNIDCFAVSTQTYPRKQDWLVLNSLAGLGATVYRFAFDVRLLQSPLIGEWSEDFGKNQVGSSAMPFKTNPINAEKIDSLGRYLAGLPRVAWDNAAHTVLERTLDDSANRRLLLPQAFLIADELLDTTIKLVAGLEINENATAHNLDVFKILAAIEPLLMALCKVGANRQDMHEIIRYDVLRFKALGDSTASNKLVDDLSSNEELLQYLSADEIRQKLQSVDKYVGFAPEHARSMALELRNY